MNPSLTINLQVGKISERPKRGRRILQERDLWAVTPESGKSVRQQWQRSKTNKQTGVVLGSLKGETWWKTLRSPSQIWGLQSAQWGGRGEEVENNVMCILLHSGGLRAALTRRTGRRSFLYVSLFFSDGAFVAHFSTFHRRKSTDLTSTDDPERQHSLSNKLHYCPCLCLIKLP
jgi:hypothetical protein